MDTREILRKKHPKDGGCPAVNYDKNGEVLEVNENFRKFRVKFENAVQKIIKHDKYEEIFKVLHDKNILRNV